MKVANVCADREDVMTMTESGGRQCPHCQSSQTIKDGHCRGRQRYACRTCGRTFGDNPAPPEFPRIRLVERFHTFMADFRHPMPLRTLAHHLGVSVSTAFHWRHLLMRSLSFEQLDSPPQLNGRIVVLTSNVASPGIKDTLEAMENGKLPHDTVSMPGKIMPRGVLFGQTLHMVEWGPDGPLAQNTLFLPADQGEIPLVDLWLHDHMAPGAMLCWENRPYVQPALRSGQQVLPDYGPESFDDSPPTYLEKLAEFLGPERAAKFLPPWLRTPEAYQASRAGQAVKRLFQKWMKKFRGVSTAYFDEYVCWFNACWRRIAQELATPTAIR
jgi:transposase-like protein